MFDYPSPNPVIRANQERRIAADTIMGVLASAGRPAAINPGELTIRPKLALGFREREPRVGLPA
jgi:hypothetical protein